MNSELHFSPSLHHCYLLDRVQPHLSYDGGPVVEWQTRLRSRLIDMLGFGAEERVPLAPRSLWKKEHPLGTIEKVVFTAEPFADVMAYVCLPRDVEPPYDFWICLQGHSTGAHVSIARERENEDAPFAVEGDRDFGLECRRSGQLPPGDWQRRPALLCRQEPLTGSTDGWRLVELQVTPLPGDYAAFINLEMTGPRGGKGQVWVDDISFEKTREM